MASGGMDAPASRPTSLWHFLVCQLKSQAQAWCLMV